MNKRIFGAALLVILVASGSYFAPRLWNRPAVLSGETSSGPGGGNPDEASKSRRPDHDPSAKKKPPTDDAGILQISNVISNRRFPPGADESKIALAEDIKIIDGISGRETERDVFFQMLALKYTKDAFELRKNTAELVHKMEILHEQYSDLHGTRLSSRFISESLAELGGLVHNLQPEESGRIKADLAGDLISGKQTGKTVLGNILAKEIDPKSTAFRDELRMIPDKDVRGETEKALLGEDHTVDPARTKMLAGLYLSDESLVGADKEIAKRLFGVALEKFPEELSKEILDAPKGQKRDLAIEQMIFRIAQVDPENAKLWFAEIEDIEVRSRSIKDLDGTRRGIGSVPKLDGNPAADPF